MNFLMKSSKRVLFFGRANDPFSKRVYKFLLKKFNIVKCIWNKKPRDKNINIKIFDNVDLLISFRSYYIFKKKHLDKIKLLSINFHPGPPKYRGFGCANYAIYNKDNYYGVTAHLINEKIDKGKILDVKKFKIDKDINLNKLLNLAHSKQISQLKFVINKIIKINFEYSKILKEFRNDHKWSLKLGKKKDLDKFYEIKSNLNSKEFNLKVRATKIGKFKPYKLVNKKVIYI